MAINYPREHLRLLSEEDVLTILTPADAIALAEDTFYRVGTGEITVGRMGLMYIDPEQKNNFHSMPAILRHRAYAGVKWIDTYTAPLPGYPFSHGNLVILSDTHTGSPVALVGATNITNMRTAGGHGVVQAKHLTNPEPEVLTVFGCGAQARAGIRGFLEGFPSVRQIRLFSRSRGPTEEVRQQYDSQVEVALCATPEEALSGSNLVLMASGAQQPLFSADLIRPGTTIIGIEGFRDMDPRLGRIADKWYLGYRETDANILRNPRLNPGHLLTEADVFGDMTELLTGKIPSREREDEIIVSTHMGMGAHDVNCAATVYERACAQNLGQKFQLV